MLNKLSTYLLVLCAALALASCSDPMDEITSLITGRNFSPTNFTAKVKNKTNVQLTWDGSSDADCYKIEVYAGDSLEFNASNLVQTIEGLTASSSPYTITGLDGETQYSFRIQAITSTDASRDSKWTGAACKTDAEQIFYALGESQVGAKWVTLSWPATYEATTITLTPSDGGTAITYSITADDIAQGTATITGLTPETEYTAVMKRSNGKTRGTLTFTTGIDLADTDILVSPGDDIRTKIENAPAGYRLVIKPGTYMISSDTEGKAGVITINKNVTLKGLRASDHPVIQGRFALADGASLVLDQVNLDGSQNETTDHAITYATAGKFNELTITNSEIHNFTKGFFYINEAALINTIDIENCIIYHIECSGGDCFDSRKGGYNTFNFIGNTMYDSANSRDVVRMDNASSKVSATPVITFDHNTFYHVGDGDANYRFFYVRFTGNAINFTNNIVVGFNNKRGFANQKTTAIPTFKNNFYYDCKNLQSLAEGNTETTITCYDTNGTTLSSDPFKDAAHADFTLINDEVTGGDPRWIK